MSFVRLFLPLLAILALIPEIRAQVTVAIETEQPQYLAKETLNVKVRITNFSGQTLRLGDQPDWLTFTIQTQEGFVVSKIADVPVIGEFELESSKVGTKTVNLAPYYDIIEPGRYQVTASVRVPLLKQVITSPPAKFGIFSGAPMWELEVGIPPEQWTDKRVPEIRKYALLQANQLRQLKLYVRVSNPDDSIIYRVFPLGQMVSFSRPEPQVDRKSNLHVLYQAGARSFHYFVIDPSGEVLLRQTHRYTNTRPQLKADAEGEIRLFGGARLLTPQDINPPIDLSSRSEKPAQKAE